MTIRPPASSLHDAPPPTRTAIVVVMLTVPACAGSNAIAALVAEGLPTGHPWRPYVACAVLPASAEDAVEALRELDRVSELPPTKPVPAAAPTLTSRKDPAR